MMNKARVAQTLVLLCPLKETGLLIESSLVRNKALLMNQSLPEKRKHHLSALSIGFTCWKGLNSLSKGIASSGKEGWTTTGPANQKIQYYPYLQTALEAEKPLLSSTKVRLRTAKFI